MRRSRLPLTIGFVAFALASIPVIVGAHAERPVDSPVRPGAVPDPGREPTAVLDVCKTGECAYEHVQAAVIAADDGTLIRIWPGLYKEEPSRGEPFLPPDGEGFYTYQHHVDHPNSQNLVAVVGKKNVTLRGMGGCPKDVVIDVGFAKHVGIRGDRADGLIIENLSVWRAEDHGVYILDGDGFLVDRVHSGFSREYPFLFFATDHGVLSNCEAFGGGDAGIYPGGAADTPGRHSTEIMNCKSYDNVLGYSGSNGDHVWVHDSEFFHNAIGLVSDSLSDHPNYPQNNLVLERNLFYDNNLEVYGPHSNIKPIVFANSILIPKGVGVFLASGNENLVQNNSIWGNDRYGVWLASGEGMVIGPTSEPPAPPFMSSGNRFVSNSMHAPAEPPGSTSIVDETYSPSSDPNRTDFGWDGAGWNNCWEDNTGAGGPVTSDPPVLPPCHDPIFGTPMPLTPPVPYPPNFVEQAGLVFVPNPADDGTPTPLCKILGLEPCEWEKGDPECPQNAENGDDNCKIQPETPTQCGPGDAGTCPSVCG